MPGNRLMGNIVISGPSDSSFKMNSDAKSAANRKIKKDVWVAFTFEPKSSSPEDMLTAELFANAVMSLPEKFPRYHFYASPGFWHPGGGPATFHINIDHVENFQYALAEMQRIGVDCQHFDRKTKKTSTFDVQPKIEFRRTVTALTAKPAPAPATKPAAPPSPLVKPAAQATKPAPAATSFASKIAAALMKTTPADATQPKPAPGVATTAATPRKVEPSKIASPAELKIESSTKAGKLVYTIKPTASNEAIANALMAQLAGNEIIAQISISRTSGQFKEATVTIDSGNKAKFEKLLQKSLQIALGEPPKKPHFRF